MTRKNPDRRRLLAVGLGGLAALFAGTPAYADRARRRFNFSGSWGRGRSRSSYRGKKIVPFSTKERPGTIIVKTSERRLYRVLPGGKAIKYGVGVGRSGFGWSGVAYIKIKREWPAWRPPAEMRKRELRKYGRVLPKVMPGGANNPLGARALYLFQGKRDTLYRIHGTNNPSSIGLAQSSGCIRMLNEEVIDLFNKTPIGTKVIVI